MPPAHLLPPLVHVVNWICESQRCRARVNIIVHDDLMGSIIVVIVVCYRQVYGTGTLTVGETLVTGRSHIRQLRNRNLTSVVYRFRHFVVCVPQKVGHFVEVSVPVKVAVHSVG